MIGVITLTYLIIFDEYLEDGLKASERRRHYVKQSPSIKFHVNRVFNTTPELFFANSTINTVCKNDQVPRINNSPYDGVSM